MEDLKRLLKVNTAELLAYLSLFEKPAEPAYPDSVLASMGALGSYVQRRIKQNQNELWQALQSSESLEIGLLQFSRLCSKIFRPGLVDAETVLNALYEIRLENSYRQELHERWGVDFDPLTYIPLPERADVLGLEVVLPNFERSAYAGEVVAIDYCYQCWMVKFASRKAIVLPLSVLPSGRLPKIGARVVIKFSNHKIDLSIL